MSLTVSLASAHGAGRTCFAGFFNVSIQCDRHAGTIGFVWRVRKLSNRFLPTAVPRRRRPGQSKMSRGFGAFAGADDARLSSFVHDSARPRV